MDNLLESRLDGNKKLILSPIEEWDLTEFQNWRNDREHIKYFREHRLLNYKNQMDWFNKISEDKNQVNFGIKIDDLLIGHCGLFYIDWRNKSGEFGIYIGNEKYKNLNYGSSAMLLLLEYGFNFLNLHRIWGEVYTNNNAIETYYDLGFTKEGELRDTYFWNGQYYNSIIISMLRDEFEYEPIEVKPKSLI